MKKFLFTCFLGYLCPPKSKFKSNWLVDILCSIKTLFPRHWRDIFITKFRDYLTEGISPLIGGLFHRRSRSISIHSKNYLSDKGAVFRQPQADISQKRSDFISQAEGLHISCTNNHIRGVTIRFVLVLFFGIVIKVSSQVADSPPGIELVDNPGIPAIAGFHRSGETRSDTFFSVAPQDIDGGPGLQSSVFSLQSQKGFSLVDSDQDMRIGLENSSFQSASVSVFGIPILSVRQNVPQKPKNQSLVSCVLGLDTSTSLVDNSNSLGRKGAIPSAYSEGKGLRMEDLPVFVYGEIRSEAMQDSLLVTFWEKYLGRYVSYVGMESSYVVLQEGSMLQGASGKKVLHFESLPISEEGYISIASVLGDQYMDRFLVEPGDSLIFSLDLRLGQLVFAGPDSLKFELQHRLAREENKVSFMETPAFHLQAGQDPNELQQSFMDRSPLVEGYAPRTMEFISFGPDRKGWIEERLKKDVLDDSRLLILEEYRGRLSEGFLDILRADVLGENASRSISLIKNLPLEARSDSQQLLEGYLDRIGDLEVSADAAEASAFYQEYLLERESLLAFYAGEGLFSRLGTLFSTLVYDRLVARFLFENYYRLPDFGNAVARVSDRISDPEIRSGLESLAAAHRVGSLVKDLPLIDLNGDSTDLEAYRGKTLLLAFWFPGCLPSKLMHERQLCKVQKELEGREDFALLSINTDPDPVLWKTYLSENPSYSFGNEHLFLGGRDIHPFLKYYDIQAYPSLMLIDGEGRLIRSLKIPSEAEGLIDLIQENLSDENQ
ncbi:thiol-disulfide isomerase/thioredoxin [Algoriphagus iocasae]|uniref:Thiol-disulfide isomerase/thioredoxin n=1 Tax=Algoriphagus iocasae TaxID=1836499 RepID=A0A841MXU9_9BACT|nr:thioredoxin family protein [Algoriphagus iocasae]MBB6328866.1 thiol-disulfide isomerase/thioredoxin [Algoriphagus iocasae]